jgi:prophage antirepressor-like protein
MDKEIMVFEGNNVEVFELNGNVLFNPKHVAVCLDITDVNSSIRDFNKNQIIKITNSDMHSMHFRKLNNAGENFLTESGVYKLIFKSRKPEAEKFQDWVTDEVLPAIRKNGGYIRNQPKPTTLSQQYKETVGIVQAHLRIGKLLGTDIPMARAVAVEQTRRITGIDYKPLLIGNTVSEIPVGIRELSSKLNIKEATLKDKLAQIGLLERDKDNNITLSDKAKELKVGSLEPYQAKHSDHCGYQSKWYPSKIKDILANHHIN